MTPYDSAGELIGQLRRREISSRELLETYLDRVELINPRVNAVVTLDVDRARAEAAAADDATAKGEEVGPLHGLPMTIKDCIETASLRTTCGVPDLAGHIPTRDAVAVARLRAAGAIIFGKTNTPEWAGDVQTFNPLFGVTNNPWDLSLSPGGSSGGAAAAVAAGLTGMELGSDLGGSIRMPAGYCGVYGLRPSVGVIPSRGHIPPPPGGRVEIDMGVVGPIARSADDLALALEVMAGPDTARGVAWRLALPPPRAERLAAYRVAAWLDDPAYPVDSAVIEVLSATMEALRREGAKVDDQARPVDLRESAGIFQRLAQPWMATAMDQSEFDALGEVARSEMDTAHKRRARHVTASARDWAIVQGRRQELMDMWAGFFRDHDVLLCPITPTTAIPHDPRPDADARRILVNGREVPYWQQVRWVQAISTVHLPAAAVPVGLSSAGLPVGVQVVGPYLEDRTVIDIARRITDVVGGFVPPPGI